MNEHDPAAAENYSLRKDPNFVLAAGSLITAVCVGGEAITDPNANELIGIPYASFFLLLGLYAGRKVINNLRGQN
jgi:hypothetical protein